MGLRDEQRQLTRQKVLTAVVDLVAEESLEALSVPAVARRSGVSVATIYRHFPTRAELLLEASLEGHKRAAAAATEPPEAVGDEFAQFVHAMWHQYADNLPLLRHEISSEGGRELRQARIDGSHNFLARYLGGFDIDAESQEGQRLVSLIMLVTGSVAIIELVDRQGTEVNEAIQAVVWATQTLIEATTTDRASPARRPAEVEADN